MNSLRRSLLLVVVSVLVGAGGMYLYVPQDSGESDQALAAKAELSELKQRFERLVQENTSNAREAIAHQQQETVFYAAAMERAAEIRKLKRRMVVIACRHADARELRAMLEQDPPLAKELSSETFQENWLHAAARSGTFGMTEVTKVFIDYGVDRDAKNTDGQSPIDVAMAGSASEVLQVLRTYRPAEVVRVSLNNAP